MLFSNFFCAATYQLICSHAMKTFNTDAAT